MTTGDGPDEHLEQLERLIGSETWQRPGARDLTLWLVALTTPPKRRRRPWWMAQVALAALTGRKRTRGE